MARGGLRTLYEGPRRTCLGCRAARPQAELCRLAVGPAGLVWDEERALPGRGAYVCRNEGCALRATRHLAKALRMTHLSVGPTTVWQALQHVPAPAFDPDRPLDGEP